MIQILKVWGKTQCCDYSRIIKNKEVVAITTSQKSCDKWYLTVILKT